jgi:hypothetical protein
VYIIAMVGAKELYCAYMLIFSTNIDVINEVKSFLSKSFDMKDLGEADVILNIKLIKAHHGGLLSRNLIMLKMF